MLQIHSLKKTNKKQTKINSGDPLCISKMLISRLNKTGSVGYLTISAT